MFPTPRSFSTAAAHPARRPRFARGLIAGAVALATAGACKNTATNPGDLLAIAGTFQLVAVNSSPLPYQDGNLFVVRGAVTIHSSPRYDLVETDSSAGSTSNVTSSGQWNISSNALTLKDDNGDVYFAVLAGNKDTLRVQLGNHLGTYIRQ